MIQSHNILQLDKVIGITNATPPLDQCLIRQPGQFAVASFDPPPFPRYRFRRDEFTYRRAHPTFLPLLRSPDRLIISSLRRSLVIRSRVGQG